MKPFKVIGIGLNKTGTKTLSSCLWLLGYRKQASFDWDLLEKCRNGEFEEIFRTMEENESFEDWPYPLMYRELFFRFGDGARYILTKRRDAQTWLDSLKKHALRTSPDRHARALAYGYNYPHGAEQHHLDFYRRHNEEVVGFFNQQNASYLLLEISWDSGMAGKSSALSLASRSRRLSSRI